MKLNNSILEAIKTGINNALNEMANLLISKEDAMADYATLGWTDTATKKAMAAKYNIDSKKAQEIQNAIAIYLRSLRFNQPTFDETDIKCFGFLGYYDSYKKESELFEQEPRAFVEYLKQYRWNYLVSKGLDKKLGWTQYIGAADKCAINRYKNAERWLTEHSEEFKHKENNVLNINKIIQEQMADYKIEYLQRVEESAHSNYQHFPELMAKYKKQWTQADNEFTNWYETVYTKNRHLYGWGAYHEREKAVNKIKNKYTEIKYLLTKYNEDEYVAFVREHAEKEFDANTLAVAARINEKNIDINNLSISNIGSDPKYFEMVISDGNQRFYARSILAAEFSDKMVPHFRFIITDRSKFIK